jgi:hypothetical protein
MSYTQDELKGALLKVIKNGEAYLKSAGLPRSCEYAALLCFVHKTPESNDTALIREAIIDLQTEGHFKYVR